MNTFKKDKQYFKFCAYGFLKNLRFYDAFLLLFFLENGISYSQIGILYAAREILTIVFEVPSGIIADTYGRKNSLVAAFAFYIFSFFVFYFSTNFNLLFIAILLNGIGDAFRSGTHKGIIMDYLKLNNWGNHKIEYYGNTRSWSQKGSAISALFAGFLVLYSGSYRIVFIFSVLPYLLNFINILSYPSVLNHSSNEKKKKKAKSLISISKNFFSAIKKPNVFQIINSSALYSAFLKAIKDYIQPVMLQIAILIPMMKSFDHKRKSGLIIGIIYSFLFFLSAYASKNAFKFSTGKFKNISKQTLLFGLGVGIICGVFINFQQWLGALVSFIIIYVLENIRKPILTGMLADNVQNEILTSVISAQSFYRTFITSILAILFGFFADIFGIGISMLGVSALLFIFTLMIQSPRRMP